MSLDVTKDDTLLPLLSLLQDAINSDLEAKGLNAGEAVQHIAPYDMRLELAGELSLPALSCFRVRSVPTRQSAVHLDERVTLRFKYVSASTARESIDERWPLLEHVWRSFVATMDRGYHEAHRASARVLDEIGFVWISWNQTNKLEVYADDGDYAYPAWQADVQVQWRDLGRNDTTALYPMTGVRASIGTDGGVDDVITTILTETGEAEQDAEPFEEEAVLP